MNIVPTAAGGKGTNSAVNIVVVEKAERATALLPNRIDRNVEHSTPMTVTNWLDMFSKLNPTEDTFVLAASTIRPKVFNKICHAPLGTAPLAVLVKPRGLRRSNRRSWLT